MVSMNDLYETGTRLWAQWTEMWNGRPELALELVAERFVLHLASAAQDDATTITNPAEVQSWVIRHRARFGSLAFRYRSGPFVDTKAGIVAGPWFAEAVIDGVLHPICGMDTIAFRDGKVTEYWTVAKEGDGGGRW